MPVYSFSRAIPASTSFNNAIEQPLKLCPGILVQAIINIPYGVQFLARFQILDGLLNVLPGTEGEYYTGEGPAEAPPIWHPLTKEPFELTWKLWNIDDTYEHTIVMKLIVLPDEIATNVKAMRELTAEVQKLHAILTGKVPGPLTQLQLDLAKFIKLLPVEQTAPNASKTSQR